MKYQSMEPTEINLANDYICFWKCPKCWRERSPFLCEGTISRKSEGWKCSGFISKEGKKEGKWQ